MHRFPKWAAFNVFVVQGQSNFFAGYPICFCRVNQNCSEPPVGEIPCRFIHESDAFAITKLQFVLIKNRPALLHPFVQNF